jgi:hypothetical protein
MLLKIRFSKIAFPKAPFRLFLVFYHTRAGVRNCKFAGRYAGKPHRESPRSGENAKPGITAKPAPQFYNNKALIEPIMPCAVLWGTSIKLMRIITLRFTGEESFQHIAFYQKKTGFTHCVLSK